MELLESLLNLGKFVRGHRVNATKYGRVNVVEARQRFRRPQLRGGDRIANLNFARIFHRADDISDLPRLKFRDWLFRGREDANFVDGRRNAASHKVDALPRRNGAVHNSHIDNNAAKFIKYRVKNECPQGSVRPVCLGRRDALDDRLQNCRATLPRFRGNKKRLIHWNREHILDLAADFGHIRAGQVYFIEYRHNFEFGILCKVGVGHRLSFHALCRVNDENRPLASPHRPRHFIGEVDMSRRIEQIKEVGLAIRRDIVHRDGVGLNRNAALTLQIHRV